MIADVIGGLITRENARAALARSEATFRTVTEAAQDAIVMTDAGGGVRFWNHAAERIFGYRESEALGRTLHELLSAAPSADAPAGGASRFPGLGPLVGGVVEVSATRKDGQAIPVELSVAPMTIDGDDFAVGILRDVSERKRAEAEMLRMARFDGLTGLANRGLFVEALEREIARARRTDRRFAVLYLDLDYFKDVNDTLGHPVGDLLLQGVADRLRACARDTDVVARFGGDEFAILQTELRDPTEASVLADRILATVALPFRLEGNEVRTGASIGITVYEPEDATVDALLAHADIALYQAKSQGRGTFRFFTEAMDADVRTRVTLGDELRHALQRRELFLVYQPQVDIDTGRILGLEALARWQHPHRGVVGPAVFIPVAETSGLIGALGEWVLDEVCRQARVWLDEGIAPGVVAVNLSPLQFKAPLELERHILQALARHDVPARCLELDLTEAALFDASRDRGELLHRLRAQGIRLSIDDFGTGYSSLDYLQRVPVDRIKIAGSFVAGITTAPGSAAIVKAALGLARELGLGVIAEGMETAAQRELLKSWGCRQVQGNYFSEPLTADAMTAVLRGGPLGV
jgi:diguanylate cyclase (GGDEF)-like protein/PAS domain S-box-containing protein